MNRLLVLALVAAPLVVACKDPAKGEERAVVSAPVESAKSTAHGEVLPIDVKSSKVSFVGSKVTASHEGAFDKFDGRIELVDGKPEASSVTLDIDLASVNTEEAKLTNHLKSPDFFDVQTYPKATFASTAIVPFTDDKGNTHKVTGNLELRGVKQSITFPAKIAVSSDAVSATATFVIDRTQWGIVYKGMADNLIKHDVVVKLSVRAPRTRG